MFDRPAGRPDHDRGTEAARLLGERLARRLRDGEPPCVAAMQLLMHAQTPAEARAALDIAETLQPPDVVRECNSSASRGTSSLRDVAALIAQNPAAWHTVHRIAGATEHRLVEGDAVAHWAALFDHLVELSPEGSVALYSLGSPQLLADATREIVVLLDDWGLLEPASVVLDIGCGIGRLEMALASRVATVTGVDVSRAMLAEAHRRCGDLPNVRFALGSGTDLPDIDTQSVDLVLLIDTLPYVILSGSALALRLCAEAARVLEPGGSLLILNAAYGGDADADLASLAGLAEGAGLELRRADWNPLISWDAPAFQLAKPRALKRAVPSRA